MYLHNKSGTNLTREDCFWNNDRNTCSAGFTKLYLIKADKTLIVNMSQNDWLRSSPWIQNFESVILVHGYASSYNSLPMEILTDGNFSCNYNYLILTLLLKKTVK